MAVEEEEVAEVKMARINRSKGFMDNRELTRISLEPSLCSPYNTGRWRA